MLRGAALPLAAALAIAGCASAVETTGNASQSCGDQDDVNGLRVVSCVAAVAAAERLLGLVHAPISSLEFERGFLCPEGAGCPAQVGIPTGGAVTFTFWWGDPAVYEVTIETFSGEAVAKLRTDLSAS